MATQFFAAIILCLFWLSCSAQEFAGDAGTGGGKNPKKAQNQPIKNITDDGKTSSNDSDVIVDDGGSTAPLPDYKSCLSLSAIGKQRFGTTCADNQAIVIVDDGTNGDMTCCPLNSSKILSVKAEEKHISRSGTCGTNEVLTGMGSSNSGISYCTKINSDLFKLSAPIQSLFTQASLGGDLGKIADTYDQRDACICPEGTVTIGGHSSANNICTEQCVKIEKK